MGKKINAVVYEEINRVAIREFELPECDSNEILCNTIYTFVSPGTELRVLSGDYSQKEDFPLIPGYSSVSEVVEVGSEVKGFKVGDLVSGRNPIKAVPGVKSMWGGQAGSHIYATTGEDRAVLLPQGIDPLDYVIVEVAAISFRGIEAANPVVGETAVVIGQGMIGAFSAAWLMDRGCRVIVCDIDEGRLQKACERGVAEVVNMSDDNAMERLEVIYNGGADIVVESSGTTLGIMAASKMLRQKPQAYGADYKVEPIVFYNNDWARLVLQANYIEKISIDLFSFTPGEGVTLITPMDRGVEDRQKVIEAIRTGRIKASDYVEKVMPFSEAPQAYSDLQNRKILSVTYKWNQEG